MQEFEGQQKGKMGFSQAGVGLLRWYYITTPVMIVVELLWGLNFRVPFFLTGIIRYAYYCLCVGCGGACYFWPKMVPIVGLAESTVNVVILIAGYGAAVYCAMFSVLETGGGTVPEILTAKAVVSFAVPAYIWIMSFYHWRSVVERDFINL